MAKTLLTIFLFTIFISSFLVTSNRSDSLCEISPPPGVKNITLTQMRIYRQDDVASAVLIAGPSSTTNSTIMFGSLYAVDIPMTRTPDLRSKEVARLQGLIAGVSRTKPIEVSYMTHIVFSKGRYIGSTLSIMGISNPSELVRERPIVGGTGHFRLSSGYVRTRDVSDYPDVEEYIICCLHINSQA